jgi:hypothetical protein
MTLSWEAAHPDKVGGFAGIIPCATSPATPASNALRARSK